MPFLISALLAVAVFIWWSWGRDRAGNEVSRRLDNLFRRKPCTWQKTGDANGRFVEYRCSECGMASYSTTGKPPETCMKHLRGRG